MTNSSTRVLDARLLFSIMPPALCPLAAWLSKLL